MAQRLGVISTMAQAVIKKTKKNGNSKGKKVRIRRK